MTTAFVARPGVFRDIPNALYHAGVGLGSTGLKLLAKSPFHFYSRVLDPNRPEDKSTPSKRRGTLGHCGLLEPHALADRYAIKPEGMSFVTKEGKAWRADVPSGLEIVTAVEMQTAIRQAESVRQLPEISRFLQRGHSETSAYWVDEDTGCLCKCRPDWVGETSDPGIVVLLDYKTTTDASPAGFAKAIWEYAYHMQAEHYMTGYEIAADVMVLGFVFVVVESEFPFAAAAYLLDDAGMALARDQRRRLMNVYAECLRTNTWPGYANTMQPISLPAWARIA